MKSMYEITKSEFAKVVGKRIRFSLKVYLDNKYYVPDEELMLHIVNDWVEKKRDYVAERYDCEDFARSFKCYVVEEYGVNSIGYVLDWFSRHGYNVVVYKSGEEFNVKLFEPQSGKLMRVEDRSKRLYSMFLSLVLF